jgi:alpha-ketoglutarate-dependent taurine dioxygenase
VASRTRYVEGSTPRSALGEDVFTSTDYPAAQVIALHNENSDARTWPRYLLFGCMQAPASGGATPIADVQAVLKRLPEHVMKEFTNRGWLLTRSYGTGFGLSVEKAFGTSDREKIEEYCRGADVRAEWSHDGILRTTQTRPVTVAHPFTGEQAWFNHSDVMIIENMLVAHGREAFTGERRVVVAMGDECRPEEHVPE